MYLQGRMIHLHLREEERNKNFNESRERGDEAMDRGRMEKKSRRMAEEKKRQSWSIESRETYERKRKNQMRDEECQ